MGLRCKHQNKLRLHSGRERRVEWYADYGAIGDIASVHNHQQQVFVVTDLNVSPVWEINIGIGIGATSATDHLIAKAILGRRFDWARHSPVD